MARRKKATRADRLRECFGLIYRRDKAVYGMNNADVCKVLGMSSQNTICARVKNPEKLTVGELLTLGSLFHWGEEDYISLISSGLGEAPAKKNLGGNENDNH